MAMDDDKLYRHWLPDTATSRRYGNIFAATTMSLHDELKLDGEQAQRDEALASLGLTPCDNCGKPVEELRKVKRIGSGYEDLCLECFSGHEEECQACGRPLDPDDNQQMIARYCETCLGDAQ